MRSFSCGVSLPFVHFVLRLCSACRFGVWFGHGLLGEGKTRQIKAEFTHFLLPCVHKICIAWCPQRERIWQGTFHVHLMLNSLAYTVVEITRCSCLPEPDSTYVLHKTGKWPFLFLLGTNKTSMYALLLGRYSFLFRET